MKHNKCSLLRFIFRRTEGVFLSFFFGVCMCAYALSLSLLYHTKYKTTLYFASHVFNKICLYLPLYYIEIQKSTCVYTHPHPQSSQSKNSSHAFMQYSLFSWWEMLCFFFQQMKTKLIIEKALTILKSLFKLSFFRKQCLLSTSGTSFRENRKFFLSNLLKHDGANCNMKIDSEPPKN